MKKGCWAGAVVVIGMMLILVMFYWWAKGSASTGVLSPRAATAEAVDPVWWTPTPAKYPVGQTPGLMATWEAERAETVQTGFAQTAATGAAWKAERIETLYAAATAAALGTSP